MRKSITLSIIIVTIILGGVAIFTAIKLKEFGTKPVVPTIPESKPQAASNDVICKAVFSVSDTPPGLKCTGVTSTPESTLIGGKSERRTLTATSTGGEGIVSFTWAVSSNKAGVGNFSSSSGATVTWTSPATPITSQTWTITATAKDGKGNVDSENCEIIFSYQLGPTSTPTLTPTPTGEPGPSTTPTPTVTGTPTHRACNSNGQCVTVTGAGADTCSSDVSCQPTITPPVMAEVGMTVPTTVLIIGGGVLLLVGLSLLLL